MTQTQNTNQMTKTEYTRAFPVVQSFHTGLWGFERIYDSVNLNRCVYKSRRAAELARGKAYRAQHMANDAVAAFELSQFENLGR